MGLKTREDYLTALRKLRPNIYKFGELIEDVTTHPATKRTVESHCRSFDASHDPDMSDLYTTNSVFTGRKIHRWNSMLQSSDDLICNMKVKRQNYRRTGTCSGAVCVGWNAQNTLWAVTEEIDQEFGTNYKERLKNWILNAQEEGLTAAGALTDAKGDRSLKPSQQADPDVILRIKEIKENGIIIHGAKLMICGTAASQEIFLLPGGVYREEDKDYALACVIPRDSEGLTIVEATRPSDRRDLEDTAEADVMARANGLSTKTFADKLVEMSMNNQVTYGLGVGACALGAQHPSGSFFADTITAHTNKVMVATLPYETKRLTQEIGGGIVETGCMPSYQDFTSPKYGELLQKYYKAGPASAESRYRAARLSEWLTIGGGVPGCMHGGGSPDGAKLMVRFSTPFEEYVDYAREIMGIEEEIPEPSKKK